MPKLAGFGVHEKTIMQIGGWKTRSVFDRYNIVHKKDLADAAAKGAATEAAQSRHSASRDPCERQNKQR
jgi:hypothetical protein